MLTPSYKNPRYLARIAGLATLASPIALFLAMGSVGTALAAPTESPGLFDKVSGNGSGRRLSLATNWGKVVRAKAYSIDGHALLDEDKGGEPLDLSTLTLKATSTGQSNPAKDKSKGRDGYTAESTFTNSPTAQPDETSGPQGQPQSIDPLANDTAGDDGTPLDPSTLTLLDADGNPTDTVTVPGQGTYTVEDGKIVFTPVPEFTGTADPVDYRVGDVNGTPAESTYTPTVTPDETPETQSV